MKRLFVFMFAAAMALTFAGTGTVMAATGDTATLVPHSGVSFAQSPVISGNETGETLYVVSGGFAQADMVGLAGVSVWEVSPRLTAAGINRNFLYTLGEGGAGYSAWTGVTVSPSSPVLVDNGRGGNSIFFVSNIFDGPTALANSSKAVTGFVLIGLSADSGGGTAESLKFESAVTNCGVWGPLAWTDKGWKAGGRTGTSLFFGTVNMESGSSPVASAAGWASGSTVYSINTSAAFATSTTGNKDRVSYRREAGVSGFYAGPVISENANGVSVYMIGLDGTNGSGNTLFCYDGVNIDQNQQATRQVGTHQANGINGATIFATPALGKGRYAGDNIYSGNSLFVVDGLGGVSVYNKDTLALILATVYGKAAPATIQGVTYAGPVTNGKYLALACDQGVTVYGSAVGSRLRGGNSSTWLWRTGDMTIANGFTENWQIFATPVISNGHLLVTVTAPRAGLERTGPGQIFVYRLSNGNLEDTYTMPSGAVASPIVSGRQAWIPEYTSSIHRIKLGDWIDGRGYWRQFKFDAAKTGDNTAPDDDDDDVPPGSSGCFLSTIQ